MNLLKKKSVKKVVVDKVLIPWIHYTCPTFGLYTVLCSLMYKDKVVNCARFPPISPVLVGWGGTLSFLLPSLGIVGTLFYTKISIYCRNHRKSFAAGGSIHLYTDEENMEEEKQVESS